MTLILLALGTAHATWGPYDGGFVTADRDDAPVDGQVVYAANYLPEATATNGAGEVVPLEASFLTGIGAHPRVALLPPEGGWGAGETWMLSVLGYDDAGISATSTFTTAAAPAGPPPEVVVGPISFDPWSEPDDHVWGCCAPSRRVRVEVDVPEADAWDRVELIGQYTLGRPSQITTDVENTHLALEVGPGAYTLSFWQWDDAEVGPQPPCFDIVGVSAAGVYGDPQSFCVDDEQGVVPAACGCDAGSGGAGSVGLLSALSLVLGRRRRQPM